MNVAQRRISDVLADTLKANRKTLNARFEQYRIAGHQIDGEAFLEHVAGCIEPIARGVSEVLPERVRTTVTELFNVSLDLFATSLLGPGAKVSEVGDVWRQLLPKHTQLVARDPCRVAASLCNAVYNIASQPGARAGEWIERMSGIVSDCDDTAVLLDCGRVLAWQSGMVQYRLAALATARRLHHSVALRLLDLPAEMTPEQTATLLDRLESNPWMTVAAASMPIVSANSIRCVGTVGAFRGFNGLFLHPPLVGCQHGRFQVSDGHATWELLADAYGDLLCRSDPMTLQPGHSPLIDAAGKVRWESHTDEFPQFAKSTSSAWDGTTLAVTLPTSHHVYLFALQ